ncbi:MAG: virulence RhuM family protein [Coriobacteriales bacterium]|nr:virulence RhuM family protein [Coriobacteriales bacterium]
MAEITDALALWHGVVTSFAAIWGTWNTVMGKGEIILYRPQDDDVAIDVLVESETVWLTQAQMAELLETTKSNVSMHITNAFKEGELAKDGVVKKFRISEYNKKPTNFYNLDVIISVGYRVKSQRGVQFRRWATQVLKEYILRGYAVNHRIERLEYQMTETVSRVSETERQIEFFVKTALPPVEGIFCDGQIKDLGKKMFAFSKMEVEPTELLKSA